MTMCNELIHWNQSKIMSNFIDLITIVETILTATTQDQPRRASWDRDKVYTSVWLVGLQKKKKPILA